MIFGLFKNFGRLPAGYNEKIHGPYDPAVYYGKRDTPFGEVKLGDLGRWLIRRNKTPNAVIGATSRAWWRLHHKYIFPINAGKAPLIQMIVGAMIFFYIINYGKIKYHKHYKHQW